MNLVRIAIRYALLHVPGLVLLILILPSVQRWTELPPWFFWGFVLLWIVKDMVLFPFVWRAYDWSCPMHVHALVGTEGIAQERLAPSGYIRVHGELWKAEVIRNGPPVDSHGLTPGTRDVLPRVMHLNGGEPIMGHSPPGLRPRSSAGLAPPWESTTSEASIEGEAPTGLPGEGATQAPSIEKGEVARIEGIRGLVLLVQQRSKVGGPPE
jgi:membrane protein implicated in regulation of membrane protease activity